MRYTILTKRKSKHTAAEAMWDIWFDYLSKHYDLSIYRDKVMIQLNGHFFESTLEEQIKRVWHYPYSDCDLVKFEDGSLGFVLTVIGGNDTCVFKFSPMQTYPTWKEKLVHIQNLLQSFISDVGLEYDFDNDEFKTNIDTGLDRDTLSEIDGLNYGLMVYCGYAHKLRINKKED